MWITDRLRVIFEIVTARVVIAQVEIAISQQALGHDEEVRLVAGGDRRQSQCRQNHGEQQEFSDARRSAGLSLDEIVASRDARCEQAKRCDQPDAVWIAARADHAAAPDCATSCAIQPRTASLACS